jgi:hypothetical protein
MVVIVNVGVHVLVYVIDGKVVPVNVTLGGNDVFVHVGINVCVFVTVIVSVDVSVDVVVQDDVAV